MTPHGVTGHAVLSGKALTSKCHWSGITMSSIGLIVLVVFGAVN